MGPLYQAAVVARAGPGVDGGLGLGPYFLYAHGATLLSSFELAQFHSTLVIPVPVYQAQAHTWGRSAAPQLR